MESIDNEKNNRKLVPVQLVWVGRREGNAQNNSKEIPIARRQQLYWTEHFPRTDVFLEVRATGSDKSI